MESELREKKETQKKNFSCTETLNEKWSRSCGYLTSQTARSLEALASVRSPTKSSVFDMASFTCLTTVKQREEGSRVQWGGGEAREASEAARMRRNGRFNENVTFPIKSLTTSLCSRVSYLATMIAFSAEVSAGHRCCCCFPVRPAQCTQGWGGWGGCRTWKHQSMFRSPWANIWASTLTYYLWSYSANNSLRIGDTKPRHIALHFSAPLSLMPEIQKFCYRDKLKETENKVGEKTLKYPAETSML